MGHGIRLRQTKDPGNPSWEWLVAVCSKDGDWASLCHVSRGWAPFLRADKAMEVLKCWGARDYRDSPWSLEDANGMVLAIGFEGQRGGVPDFVPCPYDELGR